METPPNDASPLDLERFFDLSLDLLCIAGLDGYFKRLNPAWETTLGYSAEELTGRPFIEFVHPADREATLAEAAKLASGLDTISFSNRYRAKDGSYRWLEWKAASSTEDALILAVARDVTEQRAMQDELILLQKLTRTLAEAETLEEALRAALTAISVSAGWSYAGAWVPSEHGDVLVAAEAWYAGAPGLEGFRSETKALSVPPGVGLVGAAWAERQAIWSSDVGTNESFTRREAAARAGLHAGVAIPVLYHGRVVAILEFFLTEVRREDQAFVDLVSSAATQLGQMIRRRQAEEELAEMAERLRNESWADELTALRNRRGFRAAAESRLSLARRTQTVVTIVFVDLDGMKVINDRFGHAEGDRALRDTAELLSEAIRESDLVARLGGDEFVLLLWGDESAERAVRDRIERGARARSEQRPYALNLSIGSAVFDPSNPRPLEDLLNAADRSMYRMKRTRTGVQRQA